MGEIHQRQQEHADNQSISARRPEKGQAKGGQTKRQIIVHESHVKDVAVGQHSDAWGKEPGRTAGNRLHKKEKSPEENEDTEGNGEFFSEGETEGFGKEGKEQIEEDVVPLPNEVDAGGFSLVDELRKPGVVDMAAEVAGFDMGVPETGNEEQNR